MSWAEYDEIYLSLRREVERNAIREQQIAEIEKRDNAGVSAEELSLGEKE